ncbi:MAG: 50S ribosomal protein L3 [Candidatus Saganbacteria bacterium]|nr:50S ribosomal protein L3 [Candidatus Saganbacteria bacterium]
MMNGMLGKKIGMTQIFDKTGLVVPVTVVEAGPCYVVSINEDTSAVKVGFEKIKKATKPVLGQLKKAGIEESLKHFHEFKADKKDGLKAGQQIKADIFSEGELVSVRGTSIGKGFAGTVKRHHFRRSPMSHGSKSHRIPGSIGAGTTPGRVYKGKRMAGRLGGEYVTVKNLKIVKIEPETNSIYIKGAVPGVEGGLLLIRKVS